MIKISVFQLFNRLIIFTFIFVFTSCNLKEKTDYEKKFLLISKLDGVSISNKTKKIFILTENNCAPCNKEFSEYMSRNITNPNNLFIVNATGNIIDISTFKKSNSNRVILKNINDEFFRDSKLILLSNKKIDTIINVNYKNIYEIVNN